MDWLAFLASIVGSLAWPVAVVVIALIFREPILKLLPDVSELEYGKFKVKFEKELAEIKEQAELTALPPAPPRPAFPEPKESGANAADREAADFVHLALASPRAAIIESWLAVERELTRLMQSAGITTRAGAVGKPSTLEQRGIISADLARLIDRLWSLRNEAVHHPRLGVDVAEALEYARLAGRIVAALRGAKTPAKTP